MFYSILIEAALLATGICSVEGLTVNRILELVFPLQMEHYWFITAYVTLYILVPVLGAGVKYLSKAQHKWVIVGLLLVFSVPKTIIPIEIPIDRYGYDFGWFIGLFLIASYIRLHGICGFSRKRTAFAIYLAAVFGIWGISVVCAVLSRNGLPLVYMMDMVYCYNHLLVLVASIALFYVFKYIRIPRGTVSNIICKISSYTLGVYLLHENLSVRTQWQFWAGIESVRDGLGIFPHMFVTVIAVLIAGVMVDYVRECIFKAVIRIWKKIFAGKTAESKI